MPEGFFGGDSPIGVVCRPVKRASCFRPWAFGSLDGVTNGQWFPARAAHGRCSSDCVNRLAAILRHAGTAFPIFQHRLAAERFSGPIDISDNFGVADLEKDFESVSRRVAPSVVSVCATDSTVDADGALRSDELNGERLGAMLDSVDRTVGTGFVVDSDGYIVTNDHVIAHAEQLWVTMDDRKVYPAIVVASDPRSDIAVLKVPASGLPVAHLGQGEAVRRGQWTIAMGNPYGFASDGQMCASVGIVSAVRRSLPKLSGKEDRLYSNLIQTTAQINPGNSGGPLFNLKGEVIGINTAVILPQKQTSGIGFAMPITPRVLQVIDNLKQGRQVVYGYLGVTVVSPTPRERREAGITEDAGARIDSIEKDSPAAGKLQTGDVVIQFDHENVRDSDHFVRLVGESPVSRSIEAVISRHGKVCSVQLALGRREIPAATVTRDNQRYRWRGLVLGPVPAHWDFGSAERPVTGLMVLGVDSASPFVKQGMRQGAIITAVAGKPVSSTADLQAILNDTAPQKCTPKWIQPKGEMAAAGG